MYPLSQSFNPTIRAPSSSLPPLLKLHTIFSNELCDSLGAIQQLYAHQPPTLPPKLVLPTRKHRQLIHDDSVPDSGYASAEEDDCDYEEEDVSVTDSCDNDQLDILRADPLERAFVIKWLTGFIARSDAWASAENIEKTEADRRAEAVETAMNILSSLLSDDQEEEEDCSVTRSFEFPTSDGVVVKVELNDAPLSEEDHTCVGLQSWASSIVLSERICADPARFSLVSPTKDDGSPLRFLELGAGTGLLSIVAAKLLLSPRTSASIFATDYHPDVLLNLRANIVTNFPSSDSSPISVHQLDWECPDYSAPMDEPFDLILGADVVYHPDHARWIKSCVERLLLLPTPSKDDTPSPGGVFWLMMALRISGRHEGMFHTVESIFPNASSCGLDRINDQAMKWQLAILEKVELGKLKGVGRADERGFSLFKIGWVPC
ncbi:putative methyltransferase-domain-containing protein [Lentinula aciculospora]|uniref:Methyltransferase-domain-containing protein n=1 Tax=Lentinula aciculospora TaxID=153920 RepID=A0A9W9A1J8_9AGAR|nr:putative methyltransferase-domain-containing protein [Lentinula aciculospora]